MLILNVIYVLLALAMIVLILMQRGAGAQAGANGECLRRVIDVLTRLR